MLILLHKCICVQLLLNLLEQKSFQTQLVNLTALSMLI
jgi:hypothetical protein